MEAIMKLEDIKQITVIGSGTMGNGICHQFALGGYKVDMVDMNQAILDKAMETIRKNMDRHECGSGEYTCDDGSFRCQEFAGGH
jgi:3-hydroxybutyryl-CoA dehydrogenase